LQNQFHFLILDSRISQSLMHHLTSMIPILVHNINRFNRATKINNNLTYVPISAGGIFAFIFIELCLL
jgi:hypothetical protein